MIAIYPGSFNPFHEGHLDILKKALNLFSKIYIVVSKNILKDSNPDLKQRINSIVDLTKHYNNCEVILNENKLTADIAKELDAKFLIRGVRNIEDFKYEVELADANKFLNKDLETIIFISDSDRREISSTRLKEIEEYKRRG
ncbi:phosphopantetheine adenylyltransferase [Spiroplasma helicoides]|uniref:Phosphopantetheine adenylyltransferase n=1 Tax=Spiroplasma helicoides TaxID=216938 RepID=A0A1B3SLG2_9MOLU|nr:pantetheine-phosphate adenylyltransferase [Spiroplasma helicoides]AOG60775.1 phosphopantetheine adenylyltransferase [Spiroplasma helicoides]